MRLYVPTMDSVLVEFDAEGRVRFEDEEWSEPSMQEQRAILHAAQTELAEIRELIEALEEPSQAGA